MPITWRNVNQGNAGAAARLTAGAGRSFNRGMENLNRVLTDAQSVSDSNEENELANNETAFKEILKGYSSEGLKQAQADGSLDAKLGEVGRVGNELQLNGFDNALRTAQTTEDAEYEREETRFQRDAETPLQEAETAYLRGDTETGDRIAQENSELFAQADVSTRLEKTKQEQVARSLRMDNDAYQLERAKAADSQMDKDKVDLKFGSEIVNSAVGGNVTERGAKSEAFRRIDSMDASPEVKEKLRAKVSTGFQERYNITEDESVLLDREVGAVENIAAGEAATAKRVLDEVNQNNKEIEVFGFDDPLDKNLGATIQHLQTERDVDDVAILPGQKGLRAQMTAQIESFKQDMGFNDVVPEGEVDALKFDRQMLDAIVHQAATGAVEDEIFDSENDLNEDAFLKGLYATYSKFKRSEGRKEERVKAQRRFDKEMQRINSLVPAAQEAALAKIREKTFQSMHSQSITD